jgi:hypothetical protein
VELVVLLAGATELTITLSKSPFREEVEASEVGEEGTITSRTTREAEVVTSKTETMAII